MGEIAIRTPMTALSELKAVVIPEASEGDCVELIVRTDCHDLPLRDMVAYLQLIDNIYGRFQPKGLQSYVMRPRDYLRVEQVRVGSIEFVIPEVLKALPPIVIIWL